MNWLLFGNLAFLGAAMLFYILFAGADFGAGILELFLGDQKQEEQRKLISRAIAPVWEANHIWLILAVVILFVGFPPVYTAVSTYLHIPLMAVLLGIVGRGCAFTFRSYDTYTSEYHTLYSRIFAFSSVWSALFLGITIGAVSLGEIDPASAGFYGAYLHPWLNFFCLAVGVLTACLFSFLACVYLVGEAETADLRKVFLRKAKITLLLTITAGALVFAASEIERHSLIGLFSATSLGMACILLATLLLFPFWHSLRKNGSAIFTRAFAAILVSLVIIGWAATQYPLAIRYKGLTAGLSFAQAAATPPTLRALLYALVAGSLLIFPALFYLLKLFKSQTFAPERSH